MWTLSGLKVRAIDRENEERENAENVDAAAAVEALDLNDNSTEEATD